MRSVRPNSRNTIPGQVVFTIDARHPHDETLERCAADMRAKCSEIAAASSLDLAWAQVSRRRAVLFHEECVELLRRTASELGLAYRDIYSGAGHDACHLAKAAPTGMIFVPCKDGISHNERESARPEDLAAGCDLLANAIVARAGLA